jgi:DNA-binding transcriptional ArsR family regulator
LFFVRSKAMGRKSFHLVRGRALRALAYPARIELVEALMSEQPATVEELGRHLGRNPRGLYHHLRPLIAAGLVEEAGQRPTSKRPAKLYRLPSGRLTLDPDDRSKAACEARRRMAGAVFRTALGLNESALEDPDIALGGRWRELTLGHRVARLTPRGLERVNAKLRELMDLLVEEHDPERGTPYALTVQVAPRRPRT